MGSPRSGGQCFQLSRRSLEAISKLPRGENPQGRRIKFIFIETVRPVVKHGSIEDGESGS